MFGSLRNDAYDRYSYYYLNDHIFIITRLFTRSVNMTSHKRFFETSSKF